MSDPKEMANAVLVIEHQRARAEEKARLLEATVDMLTKEVTRLAEENYRLKQGGAK